jgi:hypothetical protein
MKRKKDWRERKEFARQRDALPFLVGITQKAFVLLVSLKKKPKKENPS